MSRPKLNLVIDAVLWLLMSGMVGLGLLMKFVLIPGFQVPAKYGRDVELLLLGWDRHEWGALHLWIGLALFLVVLLHIIFHWRTIVLCWRQLLPAKGVRMLVTGPFLLLAFALIVFPLFVQPEVVEGGGHHKRHLSGSSGDSGGDLEHDSSKRRGRGGGRGGRGWLKGGKGEAP